MAGETNFDTAEPADEMEFDNHHGTRETELGTTKEANENEIELDNRQVAAETNLDITKTTDETELGDSVNMVRPSLTARSRDQKAKMENPPQRSFDGGIGCHA